MHGETIKSMKILSEGAELFHVEERTEGWTDRQTDRQTDITKMVVVFRNFAKAPKMTIREHSTLVILDEEVSFYAFLT
jgi:ATP:corrinoid adenosyltransferase